jgi:hypothetical protein
VCNCHFLTLPFNGREPKLHANHGAGFHAVRTRVVLYPVMPPLQWTSSPSPRPVNRHRPAAPIAKVPAELLVQMFALRAPVSQAIGQLWRERRIQDNLTALGRRDSLDIAHVCRMGCQVVHGSPLLWDTYTRRTCRRSSLADLIGFELAPRLVRRTCAGGVLGCCRGRSCGTDLSQSWRRYQSSSFLLCRHSPWTSACTSILTSRDSHGLY